MDNEVVASLQAKFISFIRLFQEYPLLDIGLAIIILIFAVFRMDERQSSAGSYGIIIFCVILFLYGLSQLTGLSLGMSF